jgi:F420-0:gamma-glutamyl ligase
MSETVRYITDDTGKQVGVLLDLEAYRQLTNPLLSDSAERDEVVRRCLVGLSPADLLVLANCKISPAEQSRLDDLLAKQAEEGELMGEDSIEVDRILAEADSLMVLKARAMYTLKRLDDLEAVS